MKSAYAIKRNGNGTALLLLPIILAAAAEILAFFSSRANSTYPITSLDTVMFLTEFAVGILVIIYVLSFILKGTACMVAFDALRGVAVALLCICIYTVLEERATLMGYVGFSDLESGNANSVSALNLGVASAALYVGSVILLAVTGAVEFISAKKVKRTREVVQAEIDELNKELASMK